MFQELTSVYVNDSQSGLQRSQMPSGTFSVKLTNFRASQGSHMLLLESTLGRYHGTQLVVLFDSLHN